MTDRSSFKRFLVLKSSDKVPDAKTIWNFRETLNQELRDARNKTKKPPLLTDFAINELIKALQKKSLFVGVVTAKGITKRRRKKYKIFFE